MRRGVLRTVQDWLTSHAILVVYLALCLVGWAVTIGVR